MLRSMCISHSTGNEVMIVSCTARKKLHKAHAGTSATDDNATDSISGCSIPMAFGDGTAVSSVTQKSVTGLALAA